MLGKRTSILNALALLAAAAAWGVEPDYFPLAPGNVWVYRAGSETFAVEAVRIEVANAKAYTVLRGFPAGEVWLHMAEDGTLYAWNAARQQESVWAAFLMEQGGSYSTGIDPCNKQAVIGSRSAKYSGPIGDFTTALQILYPPSGCADAGITEELYLPYVGLVRRTVTTIAGPRGYDLIYARLGGVTVVSGREVSFGLALDQAVYTANLMPPIDPRRAAPELTARVTLRNALNIPIRLDFPSGQTYDLVLKTQKGDMVYRWSDGKAFTMALRSEAVPPGSEKNWVVVVRLAGQDGQVFPQGNYLAEAWLTTMGARAWSATVPFEIRHIF